MTHDNYEAALESLQKIVGYIISDEVDYHNVFIIIGNGYEFIINFLIKYFENDVVYIDSDMYINDDNKTDIKGKKLAICSNYDISNCNLIRLSKISKGFLYNNDKKYCKHILLVGEEKTITDKMLTAIAKITKIILFDNMDIGDIKYDELLEFFEKGKIKYIQGRHLLCELCHDECKEYVVFIYNNGIGFKKRRLCQECKNDTKYNVSYMGCCVCGKESDKYLRISIKYRNKEYLIISCDKDSQCHKYIMNNQDKYIEEDISSIVKDRCSYCNKYGNELKQCSVCKSAKYCNSDCQRSDWPKHKPLCRK